MYSQINLDLYGRYLIVVIIISNHFYNSLIMSILQWLAGFIASLR